MGEVMATLLKQPIPTRPPKGMVLQPIRPLEDTLLLVVIPLLQVTPRQVMEHPPSLVMGWHPRGMDIPRLAVTHPRRILPKEDNILRLVTRLLHVSGQKDLPG